MAAGNLLAASAVYGSTTITFTISDNAGGTWNTIVGLDPFTNAAPALRGYIWHADNHPGGTVTITWTPSASVTGFVGCVEYAGLATTAPVEDSDAAFNAATTSHATPLLTRASGGAIYSAMQASATATWTAGTDFTNLGTGGSTRAMHESAELAAGNHVASATTAANADAIILGVAFKDASVSKTGRVTAGDAVATYSEKTGRATASSADVTYSAKLGRATASSADLTFSAKTARAASADAVATYSEKTARVVAIQADATFSAKTGRVAGVDAAATFGAKTGRTAGAEAAFTYSEKTGRVTASQAAVDWLPAFARVFAVSAVASYSEVGAASPVLPGRNIPLFTQPDPILVASPEGRSARPSRRRWPKWR